MRKKLLQAKARRFGRSIQHTPTSKAAFIFTAFGNYCLLSKQALSIESCDKAKAVNCHFFALCHSDKCSFPPHLSGICFLKKDV
jgi:hypothetical protein